MALDLAQKKVVVQGLTQLASDSISMAAADYRGLTVSAMTDLRVRAREKGVTVRVYRNTLARLALKETSFACLEEALTGPIVLLFAHEEPGAAARVLKDFLKTTDRLEVKALALDGELIAASQLAAVASLPSKEEALTQLVCVMKAPITKTVRTLSETVAQLVRVLAAVGDQKSASS